MGTISLELKNVQKSFGENKVIKGVSFKVIDGEFVVFVGPSGCGKSTLLRMIAGLEEITSGDILIDGVRVNDTPPDRRGLAMVFQSYALYPHMTVEDNMGFALKLAGVKKEERRQKVLDAARILQLEEFLQRKPGQLSGGQRQRVAIGRAIVRHPKIFLFDEPLSNLDAALRSATRMELAALHRKVQRSIIYVTHDQVEAMTMADRIVVLRLGIAEQIGPPLELYNEPANMFVAGFIGSPKMNFLPVAVDSLSDNKAHIELGNATILDFTYGGGRLEKGQRLTLGVRPDMVKISPEGKILGKVAMVERLGNETLMYININSIPEPITVSRTGQYNVSVGDEVKLAVDELRAHFFAEDERRVNRGIDVPSARMLAPSRRF
jgi:ABC-type sugar transport systems, ATPase components